MAIFGWPNLDPMAGFRHLSRELERLFGRSADDSRRVGGGTYPPLNVLDGQDDILVQCEVPGLDMGDLEVYVAGDQLTVSGNRASAVPEEGVTLHRRERDAGHFSRAVTLPGPVDSSRTQATLADGVLTVRIPKAEEAKPKRIAVHLEG